MLYSYTVQLYCTQYMLENSEIQLSLSLARSIDHAVHVYARVAIQWQWLAKMSIELARMAGTIDAAAARCTHARVTC